MPITSVDIDPQALTLTVIADFTAPVRKLWDAYLDPRQIERFWGPPTHPATFTRHDGFTGGLTKYHMTDPEGQTYHGYWNWVAVEEGISFEVRDGFAGEDGNPNPELPTTRATFEFSPTALGSRLVTTSYFDSLEELEQLQAMGMVEGMSSAMGQIDGVLADLASFAFGNSTETQLIGDTQARVSRVVRGTVAQIWQAFTDEALLRRWQLGPDGWEMTVCEVGSKAGDTMRTQWRETQSGESFGFTGEVLEITPPQRLVTTERMVSPADQNGEESPETINELTLTPVEGGTLAAYLITYPSTEVREMILATGMAEGLEISFVRLEREVLA
ncbi:SRPBCC family protein [Leucobacter sp. UT-8R-CII-1-4]|uniref:SRPBCC family protein n=1 Tax=Leucobacter sp. UT-8R-CII-1-4 TaxID=3040075 RepID=UPI0024A9E8E6|nr:SRPBCC family protein [Leucobacter sp. UT-8R-CII-1-4]MDI6024167.1 SRPBCC family protein [Leucobacter sp. UT-8R-CII-1-4]